MKDKNAVYQFVAVVCGVCLSIGLYGATWTLLEAYSPIHHVNDQTQGHSQNQ